jgi:hypothetical protein
VDNGSGVLTGDELMALQRQGLDAPLSFTSVPGRTPWSGHSIRGTSTTRKVGW